MVAALKQLYNVFNGIQHIFLRLKPPQNRVWGHKLTTRTQETLICGKENGIFRHFGAKNGVILVVAALKQLLNGFNDIQHIVL